MTRVQSYIMTGDSTTIMQGVARILIEAYNNLTMTVAGEGHDANGNITFNIFGDDNFTASSWNGAGNSTSSSTSTTDVRATAATSITVGGTVVFCLWMAFSFLYVIFRAQTITDNEYNSGGYCQEEEDKETPEERQERIQGALIKKKIISRDKQNHFFTLGDVFFYNEGQTGSRNKKHHHDTAAAEAATANSGDIDGRDDDNNDDSDNDDSDNSNDVNDGSSSECENDTSACMICLECFQVGESVSFAKDDSLHCHHVFHDECISEWLQSKHNDCPSCRALILPRKTKTSDDGDSEQQQSTQGTILAHDEGEIDDGSQQKQEHSLNNGCTNDDADEGSDPNQGLLNNKPSVLIMIHGLVSRAAGYSLLADSERDETSLSMMASQDNHHCDNMKEGKDVDDIETGASHPHHHVADTGTPSPPSSSRCAKEQSHGGFIQDDTKNGNGFSSGELQKHRHSVARGMGVMLAVAPFQRSASQTPSSCSGYPDGNKSDDTASLFSDCVDDIESNVRCNAE